MAFITTQPLALKHPEIPFDKVAITLVISPNWRSDHVSGSVVIKTEPYRVINGVIERMTPDYDTTLVIDDVYEEAKSDETLAGAVAALENIIQGFINAKGL